MELQSRRSDTRSQSNDHGHGHGHESDHEPHEGPETQSQKLDRRSILKLVCAGFSFFLAGTNDGTTGPLLPYMLHEYNISTGLVTVMCVAHYTFLSHIPPFLFFHDISLNTSVLYLLTRMRFGH